MPAREVKTKIKYIAKKCGKKSEIGKNGDVRMYKKGSGRIKEIKRK